jgi:UDP-N-acetylglucosamine 2-epimerase (non-hydrolysing)
MILYCYGTRPEYIKIKKIISLSEDIDHKILYIEQHSDLVIGNFDYKIRIQDGPNRLNSIISSVVESFSKLEIEADYVIVQGDTASAFAVSVAAKNQKIKVIHLEAGLRTYDFDNPYPEEIYRQLISRIADVHFCPTESNKQNLLNEKVGGEIFVVGNTVLDNLNKGNIEYNNIIPITLHRRENHENIKEWFLEIDELARENKNLKFILPIHPNPNVIKHKDVLKFVEVIPPLDHDEFINLIKKCKFIISDSGGIQEEASFLSKKVIVCRKITERTESIGNSSFLCDSPKKLKSIFNMINNDYILNYESPYGDGKSSEKIIEIIKKLK